jgi:acetolactate synthase I/II/III large subunit
MNTNDSTATPSSLAQMRMPAYEALARDICARGISTVFGLMSDDTALFVTTLDAMGVRFVGARHENTAVAMAEGFASATGALGVAIIGRGPATANALHGTMYAHRTGSRVLLIFGASPTGSAGGPDAKEFNAAGVMQAAGLKTFLAANAEGARRMLGNAIDATAGGGCVSLLLPMNVQLGMVDYPGDLVQAAALVAVAASVPIKAARSAALDAAAAILARSRKPLFIAGLGAHRCGARAAIEQLADRVGAVVATSLKAKDMFRGYAYNAGIVGSFSHAAGRRLIDQADCIVAFGASLNQRTTSYGRSLPPDVPLVHVDLAPAQIGRLFHADVALVADARRAAEQLALAVPTRSDADKPLHTPENRRLLAEHDLANEFQSAATPRTMDPRSMAIELDKLLPADRNAVYDAGNFLQVIPYISGLGPDRIKNTVDFASIGMGFGTALGFARGTPERTTVLFIGDGGFLMTMGELETAAREDIPLVIVVINDAAYGAELHFLQMRDMPVAKSVFADVDFAPVAQAFGFQAHTVRTLEELRALAPLLRRPDGPILLDCKINAAVAAGYHTETFEHERKQR